jgi:hypothetical protein
MEEKKFDITLKSGRGFTFNLEAITYREWREAVQGTADFDALLEKITGLSQDELFDLSLADKKRLHQAFIKKATSPLDDPS